jgi:hypothetical protein
VLFGIADEQNLVATLDVVVNGFQVFPGLVCLKKTGLPSPRKIIKDNK